MLPHPNGTKIALLALLAEYFCLRTNDAAELLRRRPMTPSDARSVRRTLAILHGDGFLHRAPFVGLNQERGGITYAYGLSTKGVRHAFQNGYAIGATKTLDEHSHRTLDHELEISAFHAALHRLCSDRSLDCDWRQTNLKHTVHPDALFTVADPSRPDQPFHYFLEIERSKLGQYRDGEPQILRKLRAYYEYFNSTGCEEEWGFRRFWVIVVQKNDVRREGLLGAIRGAFSHRMFWLATEPEFQKHLGSSIFKTTKDDAPVAFPFLRPKGSSAYHPDNRP